jgi:hypothetical protein
MADRLGPGAGRLVGRSLAVYLQDLSGGGIGQLHVGHAAAFRDAGMSVTQQTGPR